MAQEQKAIFVHFGCNGNLANTAVLKAAGATFVTGGTADFLKPDKAEQDFEKILEALKFSPLPLLACNGFIRPEHFRTYPGVGGQDFRPYFRVLRDAGYRGAINFEAKGGLEPLGAAILEVKKQAAEVIAKA